MKYPTLPTLVSICFTLALLLPLGMSAQEDLVTVTITHNDGTVTVLKKRGSTREEAIELMSSFGQEDVGRIRTVEVGWGNQDEKEGETETLVHIIRTAEEKIETYSDQDKSHLERSHHGYSYHSGRSNSADIRKPFLGVYLGGGRDQGVRISGVVSGSGAARAGLQGEDIITAIDGISLAGEHQLGKALYRFEPGQTVTVEYLRDGQPGYAEVALTRQGYRYSGPYKENPCQVFIGVYTSTHYDGGVDVRGVINNTPAFQSGVQPGDIILAMDGIQVNTHDELKFERDKHELGDSFVLDVEREGRRLQIQAQFPSCSEIEEKEEEAEEVVEEIIIQEEPANRETSEPFSEEQNIGELELLNYEVFPNPTVNYVNVRFQGEAEPMRLQLINNAGQVVFEDIQNRFDGVYNKRLNLKGMTAGNYFIRVIQGNRVKTETLIVVPRV